jgi:hypothetical protein
MPDTSPRVPFEIDDASDPTLVTGRAGVPLVIELFRQLGVAQAIDTQVTVTQRQRGLLPSQLVERLIALWASGGDRCQDLATLRVDATLVEAHKDAATVAYDGTRGYQPVVVLWAAQDVILHDQFRDGHVPAGCGNVRVLEQAVAALPSGKFGTNAAWFRLNVLTYNLLTAFKRLSLPGDLRTARPKRLRFLLFNTVGKVVAHARRTLLRLSGAFHQARLVRVRYKIARLAPA